MIEKAGFRNGSYSSSYSSSLKMSLFLCSCEELELVVVLALFGR